jgi:superfamily II DNA or RNA helicase
LRQRARIEQFLGVRPGQIGGGRRKLTGVVGVAMLPSLARRADIADLTAGYGHVIVNECQHLPPPRTTMRSNGSAPSSGWVSPRRRLAGTASVNS